MSADPELHQPRTARSQVETGKAPADEPALTRPAASPPTVSVVIATLDRSDVLHKCLEHLVRQTARPYEVLVVDASTDDLTEHLVEGFPNVAYVRNAAGVGTLPLSRRIGVANTTGDIVAFLDDDAFADPDWLEQLIAAYDSPEIGGVGGQARNGVPGEEQAGVDDVGRFHRTGTISGNFAADTGKVIDVDHLIGCNMSFRRQALDDAGGIPDWPAGVSSLREDLFLSLRVTSAGWKLRYTPFAGVLHIGAPQVRGQRFDLRYDFTGTRNHFFVLVAHFGISWVVFRCAGAMLRDRIERLFRSTLGQSARLMVVIGGACVGVLRGLRFRRTAQAG